VPAAVVWADGATVDADEVRDFVGRHIAAFKVPARIWFAEAALPRLGTEKVDKVGIRNDYRQRAAVGG